MGGAGKAYRIGLKMKSLNSQYPLRPRGALELFDVSFKLYKKYFWSLLGCSLLVWLPLIPLGFFFSLSISYSFSFLTFIFVLAAILAFFLLLPLLYGASACCMQSAIEARQVGFRDCVPYARERYKVLLLAQLLALVLLILLIGVLVLLSIVFALSTNTSSALNKTVFILSFTSIALYVLCIFYFIGVVTSIPLVACIESKSLRLIESVKRCYSLSKGSGRSLALLIFSHGLGVIISYIILIAIGGALVQLIRIQNYMNGYIGESLFVIGFGISSLMMLIVILWSPFFLLSLGTFYTDMRIRKEGFDLEYQLSYSDTNY